MECFSGEDKLRLLLIAALSCNSASTTSSGGGGGANGGGGGGVSASGSSIAFNLANTDLDRYGEQLKAANPDLDISAIRYVHQLRWPLAPVLNEFVFFVPLSPVKKICSSFKLFVPLYRGSLTDLSSSSGYLFLKYDCVFGMDEW